MKKAKVLIPAIAVLALSAASAVTGTVAWFTATRTAQVKTEGITVVNTEASLQATPVAIEGEGTTTSGVTEGMQIKHKTLRDGSVDLTTNPVSIYKGILPDDNSQPTTFEKLDTYSDTKDSDGNAVYRATHFQIKFQFATSIGNETFGLFFDETNSSTSVTGTIESAFRVGMKCGSEIVVWAPGTSSKSLTYVNKTSDINGTYDAQVVSPNGTTSSYTEGAAGVQFLSDMTVTNVNTPITVDVYTWWEGTDANCVNGNEIGFAAANYTLGFNLVERTPRQ